MTYSMHYKLAERFEQSDAKIEDGQVTNLPDLTVDDRTFTLGDVTETLDYKKNKLFTVKLVHTDAWLSFSIDFGPTIRDPDKDSWSLTPTFADKLNELNIRPDCCGGDVDLEDENGEVLDDKQLEYLGLEADDDGSFGSVEEHDEGADRGGYVPTVGSALTGESASYGCDGWT